MFYQIERSRFRFEEHQRNNMFALWNCLSEIGFIAVFPVCRRLCNVIAVLEGQYAPISSEEVIAQNPEVILLADAPYGVTPEVVAERAGWDVIQAVQNGAVFEFDPFLVSVPGPRLVDGLESMAMILHPDMFEWNEA